MRDAQVHFLNPFLRDQFFYQSMHCSTTADHVIQHNVYPFSAEIANHLLDRSFFGARAILRGNGSVQVEFSTNPSHELRGAGVWSDDDHIFAIFKTAKHLDEQ